MHVPHVLHYLVPMEHCHIGHSQGHNEELLATWSSPSAGRTHQDLHWQCQPRLRDFHWQRIRWQLEFCSSRYHIESNEWNTRIQT